MINDNIQILIYEFEDVTKKRSFFEWIRFIMISIVPHGTDVLLGNCSRKDILNPLTISRNSGLILITYVIGWMFAVFMVFHVDPPMVVKTLVENIFGFFQKLIPIHINADLLNNLFPMIKQFNPSQLLMAGFYSQIMASFLGSLLVLKCEADSKNNTLLATKINNISRNYSLFLMFANKKIKIMENKSFFELTDRYRKDFKKFQNDNKIVNAENVDYVTLQLGKLTFGYIKNSITIIANEIKSEELTDNEKLLLATLQLDISKATGTFTND